jgi:hypothetical protein
VSRNAHSKVSRPSAAAPTNRGIPSPRSMWVGAVPGRGATALNLRPASLG